MPRQSFSHRQKQFAAFVTSRGGSMKLKHPAELSLTSICHCNLEREKARSQIEWETKRKEWLKTSEGRSFLIWWTGECEDGEEQRWRGSQDQLRWKQRGATWQNGERPIKPGAVIETDDKKILCKARVSFAMGNDKQKGRAWRGQK